MIREQSFATAEQAAHAALRLAATMPNAARFEYGGAVFKLGERFYISEPVTSYDRNYVAYRFDRPDGAQLVAVYHTHPFGSVPYFSRTDIREARRLGLLSYLLTIGDGTVRLFDPDDPRMPTVYLPGSKAKAIGNEGRVISVFRPSQAVSSVRAFRN